MNTDLNLFIDECFLGQIDSLKLLRDNLASNGYAKIIDAVNEIFSIKGKVVVAGVGKSGIVARKFAATLSSTGTESVFLHGSEASHGDMGVITKNDLVFLVSWSGNTPELLSIVRYCINNNLPHVTLTSNKLGYITQSATVSLIIPAVKEMSPYDLAPTTSSTLQLVVMDVIASSLMKIRNFQPIDFYKFHPGGSLGKSFIKVSELAMPIDKCSLDTTATIADVIDSLTNTGLGVVLITDNKNNLKGIITDGDLRRSLRGHMPSLNMCAIDLMNVNYVSIAGASTLSEGLKFLSDMNYRCAPVIDDDNNCIGAINMSKLNSF